MHILSLLFTVFIDSLGFGLVFPIFSPMIVNNEGGMLSPESSLALRGLIFGLLVSAYGIGQFFGGPLLGGFSDRMGRKKVLVGAMWLGCIGYIFCAFGIVIQSLWILFVARLLGGISAGSFPVAQSAIADMSVEGNKLKNLGLVGMSFWTGFVIGPFLGGRLAALGFMIPFLVSAAFCLLNAFFLLFKFKETFVPNENPEKIQVFQGISQIRKAFTMPGLRALFFVMFVFCLGWGFFTEFSPIFLTRRLGFKVEQIANFYAWVGLWIALSQGIFIRPILRWFSPPVLLRAGLIGLGGFLPLLLLFKGNAGIFWIIPLIAFAQALTFPTSATLVSNLAGKEKQGEILGIHNSVQWAAISIPPLFSGSFVALYPHLPVTVGSIAMVTAFFIFLFTFRVAQAEE